MSCRHIQKRLSAYQDGEIGGKERERIAAHLEGCPACRSAYAELEQALADRWRKFRKSRLLPGFERRLFARINAVPEPRSWWRFPWVSWVYRAYPAPAMAAVASARGGGAGGLSGKCPGVGFLVRSRSGAGFHRASTDIVSFKVFAAAPPGTLGDGYLRMAHFTEEDRK